MKWVNIGILNEFDVYKGSQMSSDSYSQTGIGFYVRSGQYAYKMLDNEVDECWVSFDVRQTDTTYYDSYSVRYGFDNSTSTSGIINIPALVVSGTSYRPTPKIANNSETLYTPNVTWDLSDKKYHNIEIHVKTGEPGRIDVWFDHKLSFSWRSPTAFKDMKISIFKIQGNNTPHDISSVILQDTRRIGYERFVKLALDPDTEQSMEKGSTASFTVSGVPESTEYTDITSICAVIQPTSRDANISTGTYTLDGVSLGSVDVTDSSGNAYETVLSTTNSSTGLAWTREDIEGKTLALTVD